MASSKYEAIETNMLKAFLSKTADQLNRHSLIKICIQFLPSIWGPVFITGLGKNLNIIDDQGLTTIGWICLGVSFGSAIIVALLTNLKENRDKKKEEYWRSIVESRDAEIKLFINITDGENQTEKARLDKLISYITENAEISNEIKTFVNTSISPNDHLKHIAAEIKLCFEQITAMRRTDICLSMAVSIGGKAWEWINQTDTTGCTTLQTLNLNGSTFFQVSSGETTFTYHNDKLEASKDNNYLMDQRDKSYRGKGSIICWGLTVSGNGSSYARMILSISTYGKQLTSDDRIIETLYEKRIRDQILTQFENEIKFDLALLYLIS